MNQTIKELLKNPLVEDFIVFAGMDKLKDLMSRRRAGLLANQQQGTTASSAAPPLIAKNLHKVVLALNSADIPDAAKWIKNLHPSYKTELAKWDEGELKKLFALPYDTRTDLVVALLGETPIQKLKNIKEDIAQKIPSLQDESKNILKEWEDWADEILSK